MDLTGLTYIKVTNKDKLLKNPFELIYDDECPVDLSEFEYDEFDFDDYDMEYKEIDKILKEKKLTEKVGNIIFKTVQTVVEDGALIKIKIYNDKIKNHENLRDKCYELWESNCDEYGVESNEDNFGYAIYKWHNYYFLVYGIPN